MLSAKATYYAFTQTGIVGEDSKSIDEARWSPEWPEWEKAIEAELTQLQNMGMLELTDPPPNRVPITNKWVFVKKFRKDGKLQKYKVRLVARGFTQRLGMDYNEMFSPVVCLKTICTILVQVVKEDWEIQQIDVKGVYLNGILKEEIYMKQPKGYDDGTGCLCQLIKTLYRLKQSGCKWNEELNGQLESKGFMQLHSDPCVYIWCTNRNIEIITIWVDDLLLFSNTPNVMDCLKGELQTLFELTDMGDLTKIVGIEIKCDCCYIFFSPHSLIPFIAPLGLPDSCYSHSSVSSSLS